VISVEKNLEMDISILMGSSWTRPSCINVDINVKNVFVMFAKTA